MRRLHADTAAISARLDDLAHMHTCKRCKASVTQAITDITNLLIQVTGLHSALLVARREAADLRAAIYAALGAADDGEPDPLAYLRDEFPEYAHRPAHDDGGGWRL